MLFVIPPPAEGSMSPEALAALIEPGPDETEDDQLVREKYVDLVPMTEEEALVRKVAAQHWAGPWVLLMLDCGLRRGETVPIGKADLCKDGTMLRISSAVTYAEGNQAKRKSTKTAAGERFVPMPPALLAQLDTSGRYFFHGQNGRMLTLTHLRRMWGSFHRACDREAGEGHLRAPPAAHQPPGD